MNEKTLARIKMALELAELAEVNIELSHEHLRELITAYEEAIKERDMLRRGLIDANQAAQDLIDRARLINA